MSFVVNPSNRYKAISGTNPFAEMTMNAVANNAVNLGQGFPAFGSPKFIGESLKEIIPGDEWALSVP
jgi:hypothetical protein